MNHAEIKPRRYSLRTSVLSTNYLVQQIYLKSYFRKILDLSFTHN